MTVKTGTRAPSSKNVSSRTPSTGAVSSKLVLSVSISAMTSPVDHHVPLMLPPRRREALFNGVAELWHLNWSSPFTDVLPPARPQVAPPGRGSGYWSHTSSAIRPPPCLEPLPTVELGGNGGKWCQDRQADESEIMQAWGRSRSFQPLSVSPAPVNPVYGPRHA